MFYPTRADEGLRFTLGNINDRFDKRKKVCCRLATKKSNILTRKRSSQTLLETKGIEKYVSKMLQVQHTDYFGAA